MHSKSESGHTGVDGANLSTQSSSSAIMMTVRRDDTIWIGEKPAHPSSLLFACLSSQAVAFEDGGEAGWMQQAGHKAVRYIFVRKFARRNARCGLNDLWPSSCRIYTGDKVTEQNGL
jgi:hypothetical protein